MLSRVHRLLRQLPSTPIPSHRILRAKLTTMATSRKFDCIVIGSGQAGTPLAGAFARAGHRTALIEKVHIGGCCVNEGCTPTKTLVASGRNAYMTKRGADYGIHTPGGQDGKIAVDMEKVRDRKRKIVDQFRGGNESRTYSAGVEVLMGEASFQDAKTLRVKLNDGSETTVTSDLIFINTGERPASLKLPGLEKIDPARILDSTSVQELGEVPEHLIVLGGGVIGVEFGHLLRRLGAKVTIIQRGPQLLPREDPDVAEEVLKIFTDDGITVHLNASTVSISPEDTLTLTYRLADGSTHTISGSHLLAAAGRVPNSDMLNLQAAGITTNSRGYITSNELLETTAAGVYVLGDVKGPPAFTHISYDDFRIVQANLLTKSTAAHPLTTADRILPYVVYMDPQLGHVGLHEAEARAKFPGRSIRVAKMPMSYVARALETDETRGFMKATVDGDTGEILGFTCLGMEGGEIMSMVQIAIMGKLEYRVLQNAIWAHPTLAEALNNLWGFLK